MFLNFFGEPTAKLKVKYTCPGCAANVWGKPELAIVCGACDRALVADGAGPARDEDRGTARRQVVASAAGAR